MDAMRRRVRGALADQVLQRALPMATERAHDKRALRWQDLDDVDAWRRAAKAIKDQTLAHLADHLEAFEANAQANGWHIHWAPSAEAARTIILDILQTHKTRRVIKGKSLTTEEIALNEHLERNGIAAIETDLGEHIVQLRGQRPSHITAPAIHEDTASVSELFHAHHGSSPTQDAEVLVKVARYALRDAFATADAAVTGANFLLASTGQLVLVENEANLRLATTMPRLHIAVAGIEKVIPGPDELPVFLELLARSATGQKLTTYTHILGRATGPETHVVLLDNGRSDVLGMPRERSMLGCIRCGSCLNACPVYRHIGGHAYDSPYMGPIGAVISPWLGLEEGPPRLAYASTLCGACQEACPVDIPLPDLLLRARRRSAEAKPRRGEQLALAAWRRTVTDGARFRRAQRRIRFAATLIAPGGRIRRLPPPLSGWTRYRTLPLPSKLDQGAAP